jgi:hypothetical protein
MVNGERRTVNGEMVNGGDGEGEIVKGLNGYKVERGFTNYELRFCFWRVTVSFAAAAA